MTQASDPGMAVKMAPPGISDLAHLLAGEPVDEAGVLAMCDFVDARIDCADFRMLVLLRVAYHDNVHLSASTRQRVRGSVLGFRYWMDEAGDDSMCYWSENHQLIFATCEYLAGQLLPEETFTNPGPGGRPLTGLDRMARARDRLVDWFDDRFAFGFTEWLSNTYYEEDVAPLALFVELCADPGLVERASMILDLVLLDMALHRLDSWFVASAGRAYEAQKKDPRHANVNDILDHAFELFTTYHPHRLSALFVTCERYETPEVLRRIAGHRGELLIRQSFGLDLDEVADQVGSDPVRQGLFFWLMEAFTNVESIRPTMRLFRRWRLRTNGFLSPLKHLEPVPSVLLPGLVRLLNPATQGVAIQRANVTTWRTPAALLSSAQAYQPGGFGDQQHIWQATLSHGVTVFANHPGAPMFDAVSRNFSPAAWVGNGINPLVAQDRSVLLALHDLRFRRGVLEAPRPRHTHLFWPADRFDETRRGEHVDGGTWLVGRSRSGLVGVVSARPLRVGEEDELIQDGDVTAWAVQVSQGDDVDAFATEVQGWRVRLNPRRRPAFTADLPGRQAGRYHLSWGRGLSRDGAPVAADHPRLESAFGSAERFPTRVRVDCDGHSLDLDWLTKTRLVDAEPARVWAPALRRAVELCDDLTAHTPATSLRWDWGPALLGSALLDLDAHLGEARYRGWVVEWARHHLSGRGPAISSSDTLAPTLVTHALTRLGLDEFGAVTERGASYVRRALRGEALPNHLGTHAWNLLYPDSVWVDSLMMFGVFPARHGRASGDQELLSLASALPGRFASVLQEEGGLWHHCCWTKSRRRFPDALWGRGNGWVVASLPKILDELPPDSPERGEIVGLLRSTSDALVGVQRPDGTWPTVLGTPGAHGGSGYRELSATALIAAGWLHSVDAGYLPGHFEAPARRALAAATDAITRHDGRLVLPEISGPTIPLPLFPRLGYLLTPRGRNHPWGVAALVWAAISEDRLDRRSFPQA